MHGKEETYQDKATHHVHTPCIRSSAVSSCQEVVCVHGRTAEGPPESDVVRVQHKLASGCLS